MGIGDICGAGCGQQAADASRIHAIKRPDIGRRLAHQTGQPSLGGWVAHRLGESGRRDGEAP